MTGLTPVRALIGTVVHGSPVVLATDSVQLAYDCGTITANVEDIGLADDKDFPSPGLYLWEGVSGMAHFSSLDGDGYEVAYKGKARPVEPSEVAALYAMTPPAVCFFCDSDPCECK